MILGYRHPLRKTGRNKPLTQAEFDAAVRMTSMRHGSDAMRAAHACLVLGLGVVDAQQHAGVSTSASVAAGRIIDAIMRSDEFQAAAIQAREKSV